MTTVTLERQELNLSKKDKKVAREIIEKGLHKEFAKGLFDADSVLHDWKNNVRDNRESYHLLFKTIKEFDKLIAARYDGMTGSKYIFVIAGQLLDGFITEEDIAGFSESVRQTILKLGKW
jgi:uncharacterized protein involved in tolerance to divalent cations